ncbi:hypothetical protein [Nitrosomonas sp. Nm58]|uniref:hypothetical protein n=1 Tax=Nitrosomonas sp. Nm58 TaxID=200126 RepID=UPI000897B78C|nr:hypothetical protein [Nitrosomonas sp. Nm58]SDZ02348.1 hypothetical protein SAMN05421754_10443 [Nitrosomonas sp. Nm58]
MSREELVFALNILREGRSKLVNSYCSEDPNLYSYMFSLPPNGPEMDLAIDKYFFEWLSAHSDMQIKECKNSSTPTPSPEITSYFLQAYKKLCERFIVDRINIEGKQSNALTSLVKEKIDNLNKLLAISAQHEEKLKKLRYMSTKEKYLFDELFTSLKE